MGDEDSIGAVDHGNSNGRQRVSSIAPGIIPDFGGDRAERIVDDAHILRVHEPVKEIGEAIAGMERKVGIRASVRPLPLSLYIRMRGEGKFTAFLGIRPTNVLPDMNDLCDFFFNGNRDYWNDPVIKEAAKEGELEFDDAKRIKIYQKLIDRVNRKNYILPVADLPMVFVHAKDVRVVDDPLSPITTEVRDYAWSN
jgi:ABC-type transport system substrate-binding protein